MFVSEHTKMNKIDTDTEIKNVQHRTYLVGYVASHSKKMREFEKLKINDFS